MIDEDSARAEGIDLVILAQHATWGRCALALVLGAILAAVMAQMAATFQLASSLPFVLIAGWPIVYALMVVLGPALWTRRERWPLRVLVLAYMVALGAAPGACSDLGASPAYALFLILPPCWGPLFPGNRVLVTAMSLVPIGLRLATVAHPSASSLMTAAGVGLVAATGLLLFSHRRTQARASQRRQLLAEARGATSIAGAADRWMAARLHDRLSGVLLLAQTRDAAPELTAVVVDHAREALRPPSERRPLSGSGCRAALERVASSLGLELRIQLRGRDEPNPSWLELYELLVEVLANQARHGTARSLTLVLTARAGLVRAEVLARGDAPGGPPGRGRRNLALLVEAYGGSLRWRLRRDAWRVRIDLPGAEERGARSILLVLAEALTHGLGLALLLRGGWGAIAPLTGLVTALAVISVIDTRRVRRAHVQRVAALRAQIAAAAPATVARTDRVLGPLVERLAGASSADERRDHLDRLARSIGEVLGELERSPISPAGPAALA